MKAKTYFSMLFLVLIQLVVLLLHLDKLSGFVLGLEGIITLGFIFVGLIFLYGYKAEWEFISILGVLFFCFNMLNFLFLYFFVHGAVLLFIGEVASIISLLMAIERRPVCVCDEIEAPEPPKVEIFEEEKKTEKRKARKFVGSKNGKTFHKRSCPAAKRIPRKNRVYFTDKTEAHKLKYKEHKCVK